MGELLKEMEKAKGCEHGGRKRLDGSRKAPSKVTPVIAAAGVTKKQSHGLRRTTEDKQTAVRAMLNDDEWVLLGDRTIAEKCGVTHGFVGDVRKELASNASSPAAKTKDEPKMGKDGKKRRPPKPKAARPDQLRHDPEKLPGKDKLTTKAAKKKAIGKK
jgi:hypothetical protein